MVDLPHPEEPTSAVDIRESIDSDIESRTGG